MKKQRPELKRLINANLIFDPNVELKPDQIGMANATKLTEAHFQEALTAYAVGYRDPENIQEALEFVAPRVSVGRRFEYASWTNKEEFFFDADDIRSIGADFKRVSYTSAKNTSKTLNKGLTIRLDRDEIKEMPNWQEQYTGALLRRLYRNEYYRAIALMSANASNTAKTWDTTALKNPDRDLFDDLGTGAAALGFAVNRVLFGRTAWSKRGLAYEAQTVASGFQHAGMTEQQLAGFLKVDEVRVCNVRYASSSAARTEIVNNLVLEFFAASGLMTTDPSNIKRFVSPVEGGGDVRVYLEEIGGKLVDLTVEHYSEIVVTSTLGLRKLTIS